ncbi:uncharacterized protein LOC127384909 [Apus apus]|uniref:uncharacterized protein LOC127384909 n=1 Tax=Apus apus TaxID=8895 RepID=UPI0021F8EC0B|nr:uncharacterized protein LOC127384909 [Apus apus]
MLFLFLKLPSQALSPLSRHLSSSWSPTDQKILQTATSDWFSRTVGSSPSSMCIIPPPPFPDSFLCDLEELNSLALTTSQSVAISPATSSHDIAYKHTSNNNKAGKEKDLRCILDSSVIKVPRDLSDTTREHEQVGTICNIPSPYEGGSISRVLAETAESKEENCAAVLSVNTDDQSKPQESDFYNGAQDTTEELTRLYIEEDLGHDNLEFSIASGGDSMVCYEYE